MLNYGGIGCTFGAPNLTHVLEAPSTARGSGRGIAGLGMNRRRCFWILWLRFRGEEVLAVEAPGSFHAPVSAEEKSGPGPQAHMGADDLC